MGHAVARIGVDDGKIELVFGGVQVDEEIVDFVENFLGASVGAIDFIEHDDGRELSGKSFLQNVASLRKRPFASIDQDNYAIDHAQRTLDFAAEVAVAGRVDDINLGVVEKEGGVLGENGDAALALKVVGIHDTL